MENLVVLFGTFYMQYILYLLLSDVVLGIIITLQKSSALESWLVL